ncbi:unnamed protein product [Orchesella dallaii]|uniref:Right handed beta helix domain-containing protein n=1 Tax=Orchesella dallaii TaxID=48710 RepID=A0ABP1QFE9_9HEXA
MGSISFGSSILSSILILLLVQNGYGALRKVSSPGELQNALDTASPGDTIQLAPAVFMGDFIASRDGTESSPITVTGDRNSTIISEGTAFTIKGNNWKLKSFKIMQPSVGVLVEGNGNSLESLVFQTLGKGIQVKGQGNTIKSCVISDADGGIYIEADRNNLHYNSINIQAPSIIVEEGTCCGLLDGNVANGRVDLKGSSYTLTNNVCNHGMYVTGCENSFKGNVANGASFPKDCQSHDLGGNSYRGLGPNDTELPVPPGQQQQQQQQQQGNGNYSPSSANNQQGGNPQSFPSSSHTQRQTFPAQVTGSGGSAGRAPQCTCTCV